MLQNLTDIIVSKLVPEKDKAGKRAHQAGKRAPEVSQHEVDEVDLLRKSFKEMCVEHDFKQGQLVKWKKGLRNKRRPRLATRHP